MSDCQHQYLKFAADFPGQVWLCRDCGAERPLPGYAGGIRDYKLDGDPRWRRHAEVLKANWARGHTEPLYQCPLCMFLGTVDDFDVIGADEGNMFCGGCGLECEPIEASHERLPIQQPTLF